MAGATVVDELDLTLLSSPGCCVVLQAAGAAPLAGGTLALLVSALGTVRVASVVGGLPPPSSFGSRYTRYALWLFGGGTLRLQLTMSPVPSDLGTVFTAASAPLAATPLSQIAISAEPPSSATITGPLVMTGSFAFCR